MYKGTIIELRGKQYKIQKINKDGVYASKIVDGKAQKGRPSRLDHAEVANTMKISLEDLFDNSTPNKGSSDKAKAHIAAKPASSAIQNKDDQVDEPQKPGLTPEEIKAEEERKLKVIEKLMELFDDDSTADDW